MPTCLLAPDPVQSTFLIPGGNTPGNGVQVFFYQAGTTTKQTAYKDNLGAASWSNPAVLDSGGNLPNAGSVWFVQGQSYKVVWAPSNDSDPPASPYRTLDNVTGINDISSIGVSEWTTGPTPSFISGTSFRVTGDQTPTLTVNSRIKAFVTAGTVYGVVKSAVFGGGFTTVVLNMTSGSLDSGLSSIFIGFGSVNPSIPVEGTFAYASTAAGSTTDIWNAGASYIQITGNTPINSLGIPSKSGLMVGLEFTSSTIINTSAVLLSLGGSNLTTAAGDTALFVSEPSGISRMLTYNRGAISPKQNNIRVVAVASSFTYNIPVGISGLMVAVVGGGAAGGGTASTGPTQVSVGAGGGGGGTAIKYLSYSALTSNAVAVTVGSGGSGTFAGTGNSGSTSSFGGYLSATGGNGGSSGGNNTIVGATGGIGGTGTGGDLNIPGDDGGSAVADKDYSSLAGFGGGTYFAANALGGYFSAASGVTAGTAGKQYGGGSAGSYAGNGQTSTFSASGAAGMVMIEEQY